MEVGGDEIAEGEAGGIYDGGPVGCMEEAEAVSGRSIEVDVVRVCVVRNYG
jgi:hypothetical protein